ncbi:MAG: stage 0 sporulation family protein [Oscillospiraceae bacterium]|nr:stage 0 sporulation family protein [Oscillospiraceae bacterium]
MTEVVSVRFKNKGKVYFFDPAGIKVPDNTDVIVETSKGLEYATCTWGNHWVDDTALVLPLRPVIRIATEEDAKRCAENKAKEAEAFEVCQKMIVKHEIDMKLVDVEYNFEGTKILFFFTSDGRVDFRELVKDLAAVFRTRIELRQIGVRDEAKMLGGLGICGKPFCCSQFLDEFHPVSIKMAKTQGLSLNPTKISGTCGRLMCCLKYEQVAYEDLVNKAPKMDAFVETPGGKGSVVSINLLRGYAKVKLEDTGDTTLKTYTFDEIEVLGGKGRRAEYLAAKAEGKLEEAGFTPSKIREPKIELKTSFADEEDEAPFVFADGTVAKTAVEQEEPKAEEKPAQSKNKRKRPKKKPQGQKPEQPAQKQQNAQPKPQQPKKQEQPKAEEKPQQPKKKPVKKKSAPQGEKKAQAPAPAAEPKQEKKDSANKKRRYYHNRKRSNKPSGNNNAQ